jgi:carbonic anhydrase
VTEGLALIDRLIAELPRSYEPPKGDILLWSEGERVVACGALRELTHGVGEIRRVYVRADYRGGEFGGPFVRALIARARELGFETVRADTLPTMRGAIEFYQELGFHPVSAFWPHPAAGALFFERAVDP